MQFRLDVNQLDNINRSPLLLAIYMNYPKSACVLLYNRMQLYGSKLGINIRAKDRHGVSPLSLVKKEQRKLFLLPMLIVGE